MVPITALSYGFLEQSTEDSLWELWRWSKHYERNTADKALEATPDSAPHGRRYALHPG